MADAQTRDLDLALFGATGFTGGLTAEYLARNAPDGLRWALVGRNLGKLEQVRPHLATIEPGLADLELVVADTSDAAALAWKNGIEPHAGHGLTYDNVIPVAAIPQLAELNIGHYLIGEAIFTGLETAVRRMRDLMDEARG